MQRSILHIKKDHLGQVAALELAKKNVKGNEGGNEEGEKEGEKDGEEEVEKAMEEEVEEKETPVIMESRKSKLVASKPNRKGKDKAVYPKYPKKKILPKIDDVPRQNRKLLKESSMTAKKLKVYLFIFIFIWSS